MSRNILYAENHYGRYMFPVSLSHRPVCQVLSRSDVWEPNLVKFVRQHIGNKSMIHAGTFIGDMIPAFSSGTKGTIYAFEPVKQHYNIAVENIKLNSLSNVIIKNNGLSNKREVLQMTTTNRHSEDLGGGSFISSEGNVEVDCVTIDTVIPSQAKISIIQLDIEGYETHAIQGAKKVIMKNRPILILETLPNTSESRW